MTPHCNRTACALLTTLLVLVALPAHATDPALARLSFWVPPERMSDFETAYNDKVAPYLKKRGLVPSAQPGRATVDSVFSRLFEFDTLAALHQEMPLADNRFTIPKLESDPQWTALLQELGTTFDSPRENGQIEHSFFPYDVPAGAGQTVDESEGQGHWRTFNELGAPYGLDNMIQDQQGYLWFTTGFSEGIYRYDGQQWTQFTVKDGLSSNRVLRIFEDRQGHIWVGTFDGGVCRYDGKNWTQFTELDGRVGKFIGSIYQDQQDNLWFTKGRFNLGAGKGISRFDGQTFKNFSTQDGLPSDHIRWVWQDSQGHHWFVTGHNSGDGNVGRGVSRYDGKTFVNFTTRDGLPSNTINSIEEDQDGFFWFATPEGASRFDGNNFRNFTTRDGLPSNQMKWIVQNRDGLLWFVTESNGFCRYDDEHFTCFTTQDGLPSDDVRGAIQDQDGFYWLATLAGVSRFDGKNFKNFTTEDGLTDNQIDRIFQDREGLLWFIYRNRGGGYYDGQHWNTFTPPDGVTRGMSSIFEDRAGHIWFSAAREGVCRYDGQRFTWFTTQDGLAGDWSWSIIQDRNGHHWFSSIGGGVSRYDGQRFTIFTREDGLASNAVISSYIDRQGHLWFGTESFANMGGGVSRYDGKSWTTFTTRDGLLHDRVRDIMQDRQGNYWFATWEGISRYDGKNWTNVTVADGLPEALEGSRQVESIFQDKEGHIWAATFAGASRYDGSSWTHFTIQDGLPSNFVTSVYQDRTGHLWFGTINNGVARYDGQVFQTLNTLDGLGGAMVWDIYEDEDGQMYFATSGGITRYRPPKPQPPPVFIDAVTADQHYPTDQPIELSSGQRLITFELHGISLKTRPGGLLFRYRLNGHEANWQTTRQHRIEYKDLPLGDYTFEVEAINRDLVYSSEPATVQLKIHPPYERIALFSSLALALALITWQGVRLVRRDHKLREANTALSSANHELFNLNQTLQQKTTDLEDANQQIQQANQHKSEFLARMSHDLRTPMNAIIGYTRILLRRTQDAIDPRQYRNLSNIQVSADHLLSLINDILDLSKIEAGRMDVQPQEVDLPQLAGECAIAVESLLKPGVVLHQQLSDVPSIHTDPDRLRRVLMNLLSNAVKFTQEGAITLSLQNTNGQTELTVTDTGRGIPPEDLPHIFDEFHQVSHKGGNTEEGTGLGLAIAKKSVELLGGQIAAESEIGKGTKFSVQIADYPT